VKKIHFKFLGVSIWKNDRKQDENARFRTQGLPRVPLAHRHAPLAHEIVLSLPQTPIVPIYVPSAHGYEQKLHAACFSS